MADTELTEAELANGRRLASVLFAFGKQQATVAARLSRAGVDRSAIVLLKNLVALGPARLSTLAEAVHSDPSTVSRQVTALVKEGLVARTADPDDGRASLLVPTAEGLAVLERQRARFALSIARMVRGWDPHDLDTFVELFERFITDHEKYMPNLIAECGGNRVNDRTEHQ
ncbi:MarR family winged helix-turn-helix transcriptional regulator [Actinokineospora sp. NPDC004072]